MAYSADNSTQPFVVARLRDMDLCSCSNVELPAVYGFTRIMCDLPIPCYWGSNVVMYADKTEPQKDVA
jgi:hypothetical protein